MLVKNPDSFPLKKSYLKFIFLVYINGKHYRSFHNQFHDFISAMKIDKTDALIKTTAIAGAIGVAVAAPYIGLFIVPFLTPLLKEVGKAGLDTITGVGSNALWDLRGSLKPSHENESLTRLLGNAYLEAITEILNRAETDEAFGNHTNLIRYILPDIKRELEVHLATGLEADLHKLFPTEENLLEITVGDEKKVPWYQRLLGRQTGEFKPVDKELLTNVTAEEFILKISSDAAEAKKLLAEEVEICLRRWFVQFSPGWADDYTFPPSLDKFVFEEIGKLIPPKINELVKRDDLDVSWKAFEVNPNHAEAYSNLGNLLAKDETRREEAEEKYNTAIELNPKYASAYFNLACLRSLSQKDENKDEAFEFLRKAIELDSKFKELAKTDTDFDFIRDNPQFSEIIGE
jgi:tetratricopeptide (TPR) repeat protein